MRCKRRNTQQLIKKEEEPHMKKRITSLLLTLVMLLSLVPALGGTASAAEEGDWTEVGTYDELSEAFRTGKSKIRLKNSIPLYKRRSGRDN